jgi:hypothetical protein
MKHVATSTMRSHRVADADHDCRHWRPLLVHATRSVANKISSVDKDARRRARCTGDAGSYRMQAMPVCHRSRLDSLYYLLIANTTIDISIKHVRAYIVY